MAYRHTVLFHVRTEPCCDLGVGILLATSAIVPDQIARDRERHPDRGAVEGVSW